MSRLCFIKDRWYSDACTIMTELFEKDVSNRQILEGMYLLVKKLQEEPEDRIAFMVLDKLSVYMNEVLDDEQKQGDSLANE